MAQDRTMNAESLLEGVRGNNNQSKGIREVVAELFKPLDYVTITNFTDFDWGWVYTDPSEEVVSQPDSATRRVQFGPAKSRVLKPGESVIVPGWEAYIALTRCFKHYAQVRAQESESVTYGIVSQSSEEMDSFLRKAFGGIYNPNAAFAAAAPQAPEVPTAPVAPAPADTSDLGFASTETTTTDEQSDGDSTPKVPVTI